MDLAAGTYDIEHVVNVMAVLGIAVPVVYFAVMFRSPSLEAGERPRVRAGAAAASSGTGKVTVFWLLGVYPVQTVGELCLSPVGLPLSTKLAPARFASQVMGLWFLAMATGNAVNGWTTKLNAPLGTRRTTRRSPAGWRSRSLRGGCGN